MMKRVKELQRQFKTDRLDEIGQEQLTVAYQALIQQNKSNKIAKILGTNYKKYFNTLESVSNIKKTIMACKLHQSFVDFDYNIPVYEHLTAFMNQHANSIKRIFNVADKTMKNKRGIISTANQILQFVAMQLSVYKQTDQDQARAGVISQNAINL